MAGVSCALSCPRYLHSHEVHLKLTRHMHMHKYHHDHVNASPRSVAIADRRNLELGNSRARGASGSSRPQE